MNKRTILGTLGIAMLGILAAGFVSMAAQGAGGEGHGGGGRRGGGERGAMMGKGFERLNLTADQQARIKALRDGFQQTNATALAEIKTLHEQAKAARQAQDRDKAQSIREQIKTKMQAMKPAHEQLRQQMLAVLTAEQKAELEKMKGDCKGKGKRGDKGQTGTPQGGASNGTLK